MDDFWNGFAFGALVIAVPVLGAIIVIAMNNKSR